MKSLKHYKIWAIVLSVCMIVLGLVMIFWPEISALVVCYGMGGICVAMGIYEIIRYFDLGPVGILFRHDLLVGILSLLAGVLLLSHPLGVMTILPVILGFYIILAGVSSIQTSVEARRFGLRSWWVSLLLGIAGTLLGILMIFDPFSGANALMVFIGISLAVTGIENIYTVICISKAFRSEGHRKIIDAVWHEEL